MGSRSNRVEKLSSQDMLGHIVLRVDCDTCGMKISVIAGLTRNPSRRICALAIVLCSFAAQAQCPPAGESIASLELLKNRGWRSADADNASRRPLALGLVGCLGDTNPVLRDDLAFEGLQTLMRGALLDDATLQLLRVRMLADLTAPDATGFKQPFSALVLGEGVRADRQRPFLFPAERDDIVERGAAWLASVRDYRGFDEREGWRHGVAHGADLMVQLAVHPLLTKSQGETVLAAIASQVMPAGEHFYRYGEGERLMAPVFYIARRGWFGPGDWDRWLSLLVEKLPPPMPMTQAGLAARH